MTTASNDPAPPYRVSYLAHVQDKLRAWTMLAARVGLTKPFRDAMAEMEDRLHLSPANWGEEQFDRHGMRVAQFMHFSPVLIVYYAVHTESRNVFVQNVRLTPGSLLARISLSSS